jgi:hypothetical protein
MATAKKPQGSQGSQASQTSTGGPRPRILRIGVLLGGKIVEERLIRERVPVTVGQSMKNTFSIPVEGLPLEFTLFALDQGKYSLRFLSKMDGRLSDGGQVNTLDALKGRGATQVGDYWQVGLSESSRGKLTLGDLTVLFQFVTEPPRQPKPMLPASVRGSFADRIDPRLAVILGISILFHFGVVIFAYTQDPEREASIAERAYDVVFKPDTIAVDITPPPVAAQTGADTGPKKAEDPNKGKKPDKPTPAKKPAGGDDSGGRKTDNSVALQEQAVAFANALTAEGEGTTEAGMANRRPGSALNQEINDVKESGKTVAVGGGSGRGSRGNGDARVGTGTGPALNGQNGVESANGGKTAEKGPAGRISVADKQTFDESTLTPDVVLSKIQSAYMAGLKRCYKEYLKKDAAARGKVTLSFSVNSTGRATGGKAKGFASEVDECIGGQMGSWRFPVPKDKDGEATDASFAITLQLVPD